MTRIHNLTGRRFGRLVAVRYVRRYRGQTIWRCRCDCGAEHMTRAGALVAGRVRSCGCLVAPVDLTGQRFGRLVVLGDGGREGERVLWRCRCACGVETMTSGNNLKSGNTRSCGCLRREVARASMRRLALMASFSRPTRRVVDEHEVG